MGRSSPTGTAEIAAPANQVLYALKEIRPLEVVANDGVRLRGHIYLPEGSGPFATLLELSPYWHNGGPATNSRSCTIDGRPTMCGAFDRFVSAGFAVALVNVRGTGISDGCLQWGGVVERTDAYRVIQALAEQPWSNGAVGMWGISYAGFTQSQAMAAAPPSLKAVIPSDSIVDLWSTLTRNGAIVYFTGSAGIAIPIWVAGTSVGAFGPNQFPTNTGPTHLTCPRYGEDVYNGLYLSAIGDRNAYFVERDLRSLVHNTTVPMLVNGGIGYGGYPFGGVGYRGGNILQLEGLGDPLPSNRRMIMGYWGHEMPHSTENPNAAYPGFLNLSVQWVDHYLRGGPAVAKGGIVEYQDADLAWHVADRWPPTSRPVELYLSGRNLVPSQTEVQNGAQTFQTGPWRDPGLDACGTDQVLYSSPPIATDVFLAGHFYVRLTLSSNLPDGNLAVMLYHTPGDGTCPDSHAKEVRRAYADLRHIDTEFGRDYPVNLPHTIALKGEAFGAAIPAGHRLVLAIGGQGSEIVPDGNFPTITISTGPGTAGALTLPVVRGNFSFR